MGRRSQTDCIMTKQLAPISREWRKAIPLVVVAVAAHAAEINLMGEWMLRPLLVAETNEPPPFPLSDTAATNGWQLFQAPGRWGENAGDGAWLARTVDAGERGGEGRAFLRLDSACFGCRVFVNGRELGFFLGGYAPIECEISDAMRPGLNELLLALTGHHLHRNEYPPDCLTMSHPPGHIGLWQGARIEWTPSARIADVIIRPSVDHGRLAVDLQVDHTGALMWSGMVALAVADTNGATQWTVPPTACVVPPGTTAMVTLEAAWTNPPLWWPHDPQLLMLESRLTSSDGQEHCVRTRFGFREIKVDGIRLLLNGRKLVLLGESWTRYGSINRTKEEARAVFEARLLRNGGNAVRLHWDPMEQCVLDTADELGVLLLVQSPLTIKQAGIEDPVFWAAIMDQWLRYVRLSRHHPSVVIWAVDNETTFHGDRTEDDEGPAAPYLVSMLRQTRAADPTRPITSSHGWYLRGDSDFFDGAHGWGVHMDDCFPKAARVWRAEFWDGEWNAARVYRKDKPWISDEFGEGFNPHASATFVGDRAYIHPDGGGDTRNYWSRYGQAYSTYMGIIEQRRQPWFCCVMPFGDRFSYRGTEGFTADPAMMELANKALRPVLVAPKEWNGGARADECYRRELVLMNDRLIPFAGQLRWSVKNREGHGLIGGTRRLALEAGEHREDLLEFIMPSAAQPQSWTLRLEMAEADGTVIYEDEHELAVLPRPKWKKLKPVVVWPDAGLLAMEAVPFPHRVERHLPRRKDAVVLVPPESRITSGQWQELAAFVEQGGCALILEDTQLPSQFGGVPLQPSPEGIVIAHIRCADHPVFEGFPAAGLRYWLGAAGMFYHHAEDRFTPAFLVARRPLKRPDAGPYLTLADAARGEIWGGVCHQTLLEAGGYLWGGEKDYGLTLAPLLETRFGQGRAIFCSLLLAQGTRCDEPGAAFLLERLLAYLQQPFRQVGRPAAPIWPVGFDSPPAAWPRTERIEEAGSLLINAAAEGGARWMKEQADRWLGFAEKGGTVILHNISTNQAVWLGEVLNVRLEATAYPEGRRPTRLDWVAADPLVRGLSHFDVNWTDSGTLCRVVARQPIINVSVSVDAPEARVLTQPGALAVVKWGRGRVVVDQVLWDGSPFANEYLARRARGYISQLLANASERYE